MKKRTLVILLTALLLMTTLTSTAFAADTVTVTLPAFSVTLNGQTSANTYSKYPLLVYRDITYFPMTYYDCRLLWLRTDWTAETGLAIEKNDAPLNEYTREVQTTPNAKTQRAEIARGTIRVNGELIDNASEPYPLLLFRDVTYFPLTWRFAVEEFGWNYTFDAKNGLVIENPAAAFETDEQWTGGIDTWGSIMGTDRMRIFATLSNRANERGIVEFDKTSKAHLSLYNITGADMTILTDGTHWEYQVYRVLGKSDELVYRCALKALESRLEILNEEFSLQHDRNPIESMKSRLKSPSSIMNKMQKRGLPLDFPTMQANIMDIAGVRVICSFEEDVFFLAECLKDQSDIEIVTEKDYISNPKPNGYRSLHLTIRLPVFFAEKEIHVPVEIQLRTIAMDFWASLEHTIRYKKNLPINTEIETELKECADSSREWDRKMEHLMHILT